MKAGAILLLLALSCTARMASADIYKVVGPDGKVTYTDKEPQTAGAKSEKLSILSAQWCGVCTKAKAYMKSRNIAFEEWDIDRSDYARAKMNELGAHGVPVILAGRQKMVGFSESGLDALLKRARAD